MALYPYLPSPTSTRANLAKRFRLFHGYSLSKFPDSPHRRLSPVSTVRYSATQRVRRCGIGHSKVRLTLPSEIKKFLVHLHSCLRSLPCVPHMRDFFTGVRGMADATMIPLPDAAYRLALTWSQAYGMVLSRNLAAEKRGNRWYVAVKDVEKVRQERAAKS